jgi:hypothetical protein
MFGTMPCQASHDAREIYDLISFADIDPAAVYVHPAVEWKPAAVEANRRTQEPVGQSPVTEVEKPPRMVAFLLDSIGSGEET